MVHGAQQDPTKFKYVRKILTDTYNIILFTPGTFPPILPYLNICNMVPTSHTNVYNPRTKLYSTRDDWVLRSMVFYAHAEQEYHPDYANKPSCKRNRWTLHVLEYNPTSKQTRIVLLEPTFNPQGQLYGFTMCLEAENATSPMTWAVQSFKLDLMPYTPPNEQHSRDFYHYEWVTYLNHRACQEDYMRLLPADRTGFLTNMAMLLVAVHAMDISARYTMIRMVEETCWSNQNSVPYPPELPTAVSPSMIFNRR